MRSRNLIAGVLLIALVGVALVFFGVARHREPEPPRPAASGERGTPLAPLPDDAVPPVTIPPDWRMMEGLVLDRLTLLPVAGARVLLDREGIESRTTTDERGTWALPLPRFTTRRVYYTVAAKGYVPSGFALSVDSRDERVQPIAPPVFLWPTTVEIRGQVLGPDGLPVADAVVVGDGIAPEEDTTDRDGRFGPFGAASPWFGIEVFAPGGGAWWELFRIPQQTRGVLEVTLRLPAPEYIDGITVDDLGRPVPGVVLSYARGGRSLCCSGTDGRFRWPQADPASRPTASKEGCQQTSDRPVWPGIPLEITLERTASIAGQVVCADGSIPPPGLEILVNYVPFPVAADGSFLLSPILASRSWLTVRFPAPYRRDENTRDRELLKLKPDLSPGEHLTDYRIELPPLAALEGTVVDERTNRPIAGAMVEQVRTDAEGRYVLYVPETAADSHDIVIDVTADGYLPLRTFHSNAGPVLLTPARFIDVNVTDADGHPLPGTVLRVLGAGINDRDISGVTDLDGRCRVRAPLGEEAWLEVRALGHDPVEVDCGADQKRLDVVVDPPQVRCFVTATDENGHPLPDAWLEVDRGRILADADGRIAITGEAGFGCLTAPGRERIELDLDPEAEDLELEHRLRPAATVKARFIYADGRAVAGAWVNYGGEFASADADGRIAIEGCARGEPVVIEASIDGFSLPPYRVVAGAPEQTIRLPGRGEILVRYAPELAGNQPPRWTLFRNLEDELVPGFSQTRPGELLLNVQAGTTSLIVQILPGAYRYYPDLRITAGERLELDYDFPQPGRIRGQVFGPDGAPVPYPEVRILEYDARQDDSDRDGKFSLNLDGSKLSGAVGMARLLVTDDDCAPVLTEPIDLGKDQELTIRMTRGGTLAGRVTGIGPIEEISILTPAVTEKILDFTEDGDFRFLERLPAGRHRMRIRASSGEVYVREVVIEDGVDTDVTIQLP